MSDYLLCEVIQDSNSHNVNIPTYILTDAIDDGLSNTGVNIEIQSFLENCIFSSDNFYLTELSLNEVDRFCEDYREQIRRVQKSGLFEEVLGIAN